MADREAWAEAAQPADTVPGLSRNGGRVPSAQGIVWVAYVRNCILSFGRRDRFLSEKELQVSDVGLDSPDLKAAMLAHIRADAPRKVWTPRPKPSGGSIVGSTISLASQAHPVTNPPDPCSVIDAVGHRDQTRMLVDGMTVANDLGLAA